MKVTASELNVRSGPGTEFRVVGKLKRDDEVQAEEEHAGWKWVRPPGGWVSGAYVVEEATVASLLAAPAGLVGIEAMFGKPGNPLASAGRAKLPLPLPLGWQLEKSVKEFACHALVANAFTRVFQRIHDRGLWQHLRTFDGCYNNRTTKAGGKKSTHAWGISVDLNAATNRQGKPGDMHPGIVECFKEDGFVWGGDFKGKSIDPMHFQWASQY